MSDPAYPGQWRVKGAYIEQVAKMTHWEYPEAIERFSRQLTALGIAGELERRGALEGDLVMVNEYDFEFSPGMTNPYIPQELLEKDALMEMEREMYANAGSSQTEAPRAMLMSNDVADDDEWIPDIEEFLEFNQDADWDMLEEDEFIPDDDDEIWTS